jgi:hypothetical protein
MATDGVTPLMWAIEHINLVGWPALIAITWKLKGAFDDFLSSLRTILAQTAATEKATAEIKSSLSTVQNNHLAHLADDIKEVSTQYDKHTELLTSIDKGIGLLVDRSTPKRGK